MYNTVVVLLKLVIPSKSIDGIILRTIKGSSSKKLSMLRCNIEGVVEDSKLYDCIEKEYGIYCSDSKLQEMFTLIEGDDSVAYYTCTISDLSIIINSGKYDYVFLNSMSDYLNDSKVINNAIIKKLLIGKSNHVDLSDGYAVNVIIVSVIDDNYGTMLFYNPTNRLYCYQSQHVPVKLYGTISEEDVVKDIIRNQYGLSTSYGEYYLLYKFIDGYTGFCEYYYEFFISDKEYVDECIKYGLEFFNKDVDFGNINKFNDGCMIAKMLSDY